MTKKLWQASLNQKKNSILFSFENYISKKFKYKPNKNYKKLFNWSVNNLYLFWDSIWDYTNVKGKKVNSFEIAFPINELVITNKTARDFNKFFIILSSQIVRLNFN